MKQVEVTISQAPDGMFWCHTEEDVFGAGLNAAGASVKEAKEDLFACLEEARQELVEQGGVPEEVRFTYKYDLQSFFLCRLPPLLHVASTSRMFYRVEISISIIHL